MMGRRTATQGSFFYAFNLDEIVPKAHLLRRIDPFVAEALTDLHEELAPFYSEIGRPSIDPELTIRMLIVGYCFGIRSERRLCDEVRLHLAYRWFCKLDLDDRVPHHSTFSENRLGRFRESDILRFVFECVVRACMARGLVKEEGFAVDASVMEADASRYHGVAPDELDWTDEQRQKGAVKEYLAALDETPPDPRRKTPKVISPSDPASAWTAKANKRVQFGYGLNYLIDNAHAIVVDIEATPARTFDEVAATRTMILRTKRRLGLKPKRLAADMAYGTGKFLGWLVSQRIAPHIPVWDKSQRDDGTFSRADFRFDKKGDVYFCPRGKILETTGHVTKDGALTYRASQFDCLDCPLRQKCTPKDRARKIRRDVHEAARDRARKLADTPAFEQSRDERKKVEMRFAHLKTHHRFERLRLRGLSGARDEFHLAAIVQNLKTLAMRTEPAG
ncbi:MAG: transposase [Geminicoccaceae bacterium]